MASFNKVLLIGNAGRDAELKVTQSGQQLTRFSLATTEKWKNAQGEPQEKTEWHNITVWGKLAEVASKFITKGKQVMVEGKIEYGKYTNEAGQEVPTTNIRCLNFVLLGSKDGGREDDDHDERPAAAAKPAPQTQALGYEDDIPF